MFNICSERVMRKMIPHSLGCIRSVRITFTGCHRRVFDHNLNKDGDEFCGDGNEWCEKHQGCIEDSCMFKYRKRIQNSQNERKKIFETFIESLNNISKKESQIVSDVINDLANEEHAREQERRPYMYARDEIERRLSQDPY
jgi:hypothetical protein